MQLQRIWQRLLRLVLSQELRVLSTEVRPVLREQTTRELTSSNNLQYINKESSK
jgi:hypothetical protein